MRSPIWTLEEIQKLPEFGGDTGWFYGIVKRHDKWGWGIYEIFPGLGYTSAWPISSFRSLRWVIADIIGAARRKGGELNG